MLDNQPGELPLERLVPGEESKALILVLTAPCCPAHKAEAAPPLMEQWLRRAQQTMRLHLLSKHTPQSAASGAGLAGNVLICPYTTISWQAASPAACCGKVAGRAGLPLPTQWPWWATPVVRTDVGPPPRWHATDSPCSPCW